MIEWQKALVDLKEGNDRFISSGSSLLKGISQAKITELASGQKPFAVILACADSRVAPELIFDQGLGQLFVVRVAGNIVASSQLESIEFAVQSLGARLVVVLGHSCCGAVTAAVNALQGESEKQGPQMKSILAHLKPAIEPTLKQNLEGDNKAIVQEAVKENICYWTKFLQTQSSVLESLSDSGSLHIVGAQYFLDSGKVTFFDK